MEAPSHGGSEGPRSSNHDRSPRRASDKEIEVRFSKRHNSKEYITDMVKQIMETWLARIVKGNETSLSAKIHSQRGSAKQNSPKRSLILLYLHTTKLLIWITSYTNTSGLWMQPERWTKSNACASLFILKASHRYGSWDCHQNPLTNSMVWIWNSKSNSGCKLRRLRT